MSDPELPPQFRPPLSNKLGYKNNYDEVKDFMENYQVYSNSFYTKQSPKRRFGGNKKHNLEYNDKVSDNQDESIVPQAINQKQENFEEIIPLSDINQGREMYWFKWDSYD